MCINLKKKDYVFSNHRGHGHYIAKGGNLKSMISELYCKETGCSKGRGGSMHLIDTSVGLLGSSAIVGGGIPVATGAALSSYIKNDNKVTVVFFGDGASEEGILYESLNFAKLKNLPIIFVCENNLYSVYTYIAKRQYGKDIYLKAKGFGIPSFSVDGINVFDVYSKAKEAIERARKSKVPTFLEFKVARWRDHAGIGSL